MRLILLLCLATLAHAQTRDELRTILIEHEGYSATPYRDTRGIRHIGIGHRILPSESIRRWSKTEIDRAFNRDLAIATDAARDLFPTFPIHPVAVRIVLIELAFQCGRTGLGEFSTFRAAINRYDYISAAQALGASRLAWQTPERVADHESVLTSAVKPPQSRRFLIP